MDRRDLIRALHTLVSAPGALPIPAFGQTRVPRIALITGNSKQSFATGLVEIPVIRVQHQPQSRESAWDQNSAVRPAARRPGDRMKSFLLLATILLTIATSAAAQTLPRIAFLSPISEAGSALRMAAFKDGLRDNGLIEGKHYVIDARYADGNIDRFPALAQDVVKSNAAVIVAVHVASIRAAQQDGLRNFDSKRFRDFAVSPRAGSPLRR